MLSMAKYIKICHVNRFLVLNALFSMLRLMKLLLDNGDQVTILQGDT
jgi:hypothetical protein